MLGTNKRTSHQLMNLGDAGFLCDVGAEGGCSMWIRSKKISFGPADGIQMGEGIHH